MAKAPRIRIVTDFLKEIIAVERDLISGARPPEGDGGSDSDVLDPPCLPSRA